MKTCIACGCGQGRSLYPGIDVCPVCGFSWANVDFSDQQWQAVYSDGYFLGEEYVDYFQEEAALRRNFRRNLKFVRHFCTGGRLLEIGCAYGFFLDEARKCFDVTGVDIYPNGCRYAREKLGLDTHCTDFLKMHIPEESFDAVVMWDVLEHLPRPDLFFRKIYQILKANGRLFFCTLDRMSFLARLQGRRWRQIHPPTHVSYFSLKSLRIMLERAGMELIKVAYFGEFRSWDNTFFNLFTLRGKQPGVYRQLKQWGWLRGIYYLNTFDHFYCATVKLR